MRFARQSLASTVPPVVRRLREGNDSKWAGKSKVFGGNARLPSVRARGLARLPKICSPAGAALGHSVTVFESWL